MGVAPLFDATGRRAFGLRPGGGILDGITHIKLSDSVPQQDGINAKGIGAGFAACVVTYVHNEGVT